MSDHERTRFGPLYLILLALFIENVWRLIEAVRGR